MITKLILLCGISYSGKSTYANNFLSKNKEYLLISSDAIRKELTGSEEDFSKDHYIWNHVIPERIESALVNGKSVLFDATLLNPKSRKNFISMAKQLNISVECKYFLPNLALSLERQKTRDRVVPTHILESQAAKFVKPSLKEGFDLVINLDVLGK